MDKTPRVILKASMHTKEQCNVESMQYLHAMQLWVEVEQSWS